MPTRHHAAHPPSTVAPNLDVNKKPNYTPPVSATETNAAKTTVVNPNPSLGPVNINTAPASVKAITRETDNQNVDADEDDDALLVS